MASTQHPLTQKLLSFLKEIGNMLPEPFETPYAYIRRTSRLDRPKYSRIVNQLKKRNLVLVETINGKKFISLTQKGELENLFYKARMPSKPKKWDGKWRVFIFDIPEQARKKREQLRRLLQHNHFSKLQASVFISPYPLNRDCLQFLQKSGLSNYIRLLRVDEMDNDSQLRKKYHLKHTA
jgi:phenylacetic acid degradation operon negative regulatory protein